MTSLLDDDLFRSLSSHAFLDNKDLRCRHETHVSTQQTQARPHPRLSCPHGNRRWAQDSQCSPRQRSPAACSLRFPAGPHLAQVGGRSRVRRPVTVFATPSAFPRRARLLLAGEFVACLRTGQQLVAVYFRLNIAPNGAEPRLGIAVSKKVDKRAVQRNRIKRCARESFRRHRGELPCADYLLTAKHEAAAASFVQLVTDLEDLWRRSRSLKPSTTPVTMRAAIASAATDASDASSSLRR